MKKRNPAGITLIELIIVVFIAGILALTIGILMVRSFESWKRAADRITTDNDVRYFRRNLEYQFRSATTNPAAITQTTVANDTLRFASYFNNYNLSNQYTQNEYRVDSGNLVRRFWNVTSPTIDSLNWSTTPDQTETIVPNVISLQFQWVGIDPSVSTTTVAVTVIQSKALPQGGVYTSSTTFTIKGRNRG
ncbi:MAG: prepilin-type N-terminal cleavage/methylation domain-containing protein [Elusimicrobia bacterium]|nr:prepilin-type N-terminal cleavage/methylation domain-containing protein [Elusimicrobiota bacterium]